jgi:hypothetical protein
LGASILLGTAHLSGSPPIPDVSPFLLKIHASRSEDFHASGVGEAVDRVMIDIHGYKVLAEDGTDAELLAAQLSMISVG